MNATVERDVMAYDVLIVGGGPAGLSAACRIKQENSDLEVCLLEKGSEVGAHLISGAVLETRALDELFPDWQERGAPLDTPVSRDEFIYLANNRLGMTVPTALLPRPMHNQGNYIVSLSKLGRWLAEQAEALGVEIYAGFPAATPIIESGIVKGVITGDMGLDAQNQPKADFTPGIELRAAYTLLAEGSRGHIGQQLIQHFALDKDCDPQHYGLGLKELWSIDPAKHEPGLVIHGAGWPLTGESSGGFFLYHQQEPTVAVGLIVDLNYSNPYLSPFQEFQRLKHHPRLARYLEGGQRLNYGARSITKGGLHSLPRMSMPGALLIGCNAGTLNFAKIKGNHTAMKSGMLAGETVAQALAEDRAGGQDLNAYDQRFKDSWLYEELNSSRNFGAALHKAGPILGGAFNFVEQNWFKGRVPWNLRDQIPDHAALKSRDQVQRIEYPAPDGRLSFDVLTSVYLTNTHHDENQPNHLQLQDSSIPIEQNLPLYDEPAQRYCPAGVYEIVRDDNGQARFRINFANCIHCKTCDIKDPAQNIRWTPPEGGEGPEYADM